MIDEYIWELKFSGESYKAVYILISPGNKKNSSLIDGLVTDMNDMTLNSFLKTGWQITNTLNLSFKLKKKHS